MKRLQKPWTTTSRIPEILHVMLNLLLIYDLAVIGVGLNSSADFPRHDGNRFESKNLRSCASAPA
jgi:hypothetical protein